MEWSVRFEISDPRPALTEEHADAVMDALARYAPAVSYAPRAMSVRFCVRASGPQRATDAGHRLLQSALNKAGISGARIIEVEVQEIAGLDRSVKESNVPDLLGVTELAQVLKVTKQRASELAASPGFPKPIATLASGPVWKKSTVARHIGHWARRPGRPKKIVEARA